MRTAEAQYRGVKYTCELPTLHAVETGERLKYRGACYLGSRTLVCGTSHSGEKLVYRGISW